MKKIKLLALTLAFCLIASVIPAPVASAADGDTTDTTVLYPIIVDLANPSGKSIVLYNSNTGTNNLTQAPVFDTNGFSFDTTAIHCYAITWNTTGFNFRLASTDKAMQHITLNVKAPVGEYAVFVKGLNQEVEVTVGNSDTVTVKGTTGIDKVLDSVVLDDSGAVDIKFRNTTLSAYNLLVNQIIFVPVGVVNVDFTTNTVPGTKGVDNAASEITYDKFGCMLLTDTTKTNLSNETQVKAGNLYFRGSATAKVTFTVLVPKDGVYSVKLTADKQSTACKWSVIVGGQKAGTVNLYNSSTKETEFHLNNVNLTAGVSEITLESEEVIAGYNTPLVANTALKKITLTEAEAVTVDNSNVFGDISAYITRDDNGTVFTAFSGIDSTNYSEVGFYINDKKVPVTNNAVYESVTVNYGSVKETLKNDEFFLSTTPTNPYVFFSSDTVTGTTVTFQPYAIGTDGVTETVGQLYSVTLS